MPYEITYGRRYQSSKQASGTNSDTSQCVCTCTIGKVAEQENRLFPRSVNRAVRDEAIGRTYVDSMQTSELLSGTVFHNVEQPKDIVSWCMQFNDHKEPYCGFLILLDRASVHLPVTWTLHDGYPPQLPTSH